MNRKVTFDWTATKQIGGILLYENDIEVTVIVNEDGEVSIRELALIRSEPAKNIDGQTIYSDPPFNRRAVMVCSERIDLIDTDDCYLRELGKDIIETLQGDEEFTTEAMEKGGLVYVGRGQLDPDGHFRFAAE